MGKTAVGLLVAVAFVATAAQEPTPFRTGASYVRVDVFPTAKGEPVVDLEQDDFEILEDKVPQSIATFEHVVVRGRVPDSQMREPATVAESRDALRTGRGRVFVVFFDQYFVEAAASTRIRRPLVDALDRALGADDLLAVMKTGMAASDLTFTPKHATAEGVLSSMWGQRDLLLVDDPIEDTYRACYPHHADVAQEMIARRRESRTLASLHELVDYLGSAREERTSVLVVTDGWVLLREDANLARPLTDDAPPGSGAPLGVNPRTGRTPSDVDGDYGSTLARCERDRAQLAFIDDEREELEIEQRSNRANVSFFPVDPRGLTAFDASPVATPNFDPRRDASVLRTRIGTLRALAENTDGTAIVQTNNTAAAMMKVANDLSSYYLLGYNSTGKLDGKFHSITVRVKRPGVDVRARKGFLALTTAEAAARSRASAAAPATVISAETTAVISALAALGASAREEAIHFQAVAGWHGDKVPTVWATADVSGDDWKNGGEIDVSLVNADNSVLATEHATVPGGTTPRGFRAALTPASPVAPGTYSVVAKARGTGASLVTDTVRLAIPAAPASSGALMFRRGPSTGNKDVPTADARFRRTERVRIDVPAGGETAADARLLDRTGRAMSIPLVASIRHDADGSSWRTTQLALAPLATGDYVIEITRSQSSVASSETERSLVAFRIVP